MRDEVPRYARDFGARCPHFDSRRLHDRGCPTLALLARVGITDPYVGASYLGTPSRSVVPTLCRGGIRN